MLMDNAKKLLEENKQVQLEEQEQLNESLILAGGILFVLYFVLPFIVLLMINYMGILSSTRPKYSEKLSNELNKITNLNLKVYTYTGKASLNAFHVGTTRIFIGEDLIKLSNKREIIAILLHEAGHYANKDLIKRTFVVEPILKIAIASIAAPFLLMHPIAGVLVYRLLGIAKNTAMALGPGRRAEYLADSYAAHHGYKKEMISVLDKLEKEAKKRICESFESKAECITYMKNRQAFDEHPELWKRKMNLKSNDLKYTEKVLKDGKIIYVRKSYKELRKVFKELNKEMAKVKEEELKKDRKEIEDAVVEDIKNRQNNEKELSRKV